MQELTSRLLTGDSLPMTEPLQLNINEPDNPQFRGPLLSVTDQNQYAYESHATQPFFNNQNTILMVARSCDGDLMLMHETRIFYFTYEPNDSSTLPDTLMMDDVNYAKAADHMIQVILGMLTVRKYRLLTSFYLLWHILDYAMLFSLIALLFFSTNYDTYLAILNRYKFIFLVFGIEVFYSVLEYIVKIWILNRVSIYIGFILYGLYAAVFTYYKIWSTAVIMLFLLRFVAFIFTMTIDFCIDLEIEYDLYERTIHALDVPFCFKSENKERLALLHVSNHNEIQLAPAWRFRGTKCSWTSENAFKCVPYNRYEYIRGTPMLGYRCPFNIMFFITYCIIGIPLMIFISLTVGCLTIKRRICCCGRAENTIFNECRHRYSY